MYCLIFVNKMLLFSARALLFLENDVKTNSLIKQPRGKTIFECYGILIPYSTHMDI